MINFNWKKINNKFGWDKDIVVNYFRYLSGINIKKYKHINKIKTAVFPQTLKTSFLIYPKDLLTSNYTNTAIYQYIELASLRNPFDYHIRGIRYIPLAFVEEYQLETIEYNPLLKVENDKVYFKYEQE